MGEGALSKLSGWLLLEGTEKLRGLGKGRFGWVRRIASDRGWEYRVRGEREIGARRPGLARPGQRPLRRFDFADFLPAAPGLLDHLSPMPSSRINLDSDGAAEVSCDCGALPLRVGVGLSETCECRRVFVHFGRGDVRGVRLPEGDDDDE